MQCIVVVMRDLLTLASMRGTDFGVTHSWFGVEFPMGLKHLWWSSLGGWQPPDTGMRSCSLSVPSVQQNNLTFEEDNERVHVATVCRDFLAVNNIIPHQWPGSVLHQALVWSAGQKGEESYKPTLHPCSAQTFLFPFNIYIFIRYKGLAISLISEVQNFLKERKKEVLYLKTHSTHFIYGYMASDTW